jgi:proton glutamate symport protein
MKVVSWAMLLAPYAVFGLLAQISIRMGLSAILGLSIYLGTVLGGLLILGVVYVTIAWIGGRVSPFRFLRATREVQLLAFSTSSSAAVMPLSMKTVQEGLAVPASIAQFVIPLGATVNMAGTALYQVVAAVFLTQVFDVPLTLGSLLLLSATTIGASIGSPSSPGAGVVILATILQGMGIPPGGVALIIGVDRILDMSRTTINVTGDLVACVVLKRWSAPSELETGEPK